MSEIQQYKEGNITETQVNALTNVLQILKLPTDNIIAEPSERDVIRDNLPGYIQSLPDTVKIDARYLSKFVIGAGIGLFDYALNSLWNEVVISLRKKALAYGLDIFFDAAIGGNLREAYSKEEDLAGLKDVVLLDTCKKLELITEVTHKKLAHILDMRNNIGVSHPTDYTINGFELLGWLKTCINEVLNDKPSEDAIQVKAFIENLKKTNQVLPETQLATIKLKIQTLPSHHCSSILRTIFSIFVNPETNAAVRKNISLLAPTIWNSCLDEIKYKLGITLEGYNNNLHQEKYEFGKSFFEICNGNKYCTPSQKAVILDALTTELLDAHQGWDNFYKEVPVIEKIRSYISTAQDIPESVAQKLITAIVHCRIGRGVSYQGGVSPCGKIYYIQLLNLLSDKFFPLFVVSLVCYEVQRRINGNKLCLNHARQMIEEVKIGVVNRRYVECIDFLLAHMADNGKIVLSTQFQNLSSTFLTWGNIDKT